MISEAKRCTLSQLPHIDPQGKSIGTAPIPMPIPMAKEMGHLDWPGLSHVEWVPLRKEEFGQHRRGRDARWVSNTSAPKPRKLSFSSTQDFFNSLRYYCSLWAFCGQASLVWFKVRPTQIGHPWDEPWPSLSNWVSPSFGFTLCSNVMFTQYRGILICCWFSSLPCSSWEIGSIFIFF